ncbi:hypothetical protein HW115_02585 [Verrucomicrobiaceae bacterium N1E253]|uniref:Plasmid stabilization protein n=1 Tax=Oceaniferula marina TaxID=2748318 RepID=A0A851GFF7_9BACT|nr:hypothetical protein [Oceaniferula marina]NWK54481.1 hypothetical protein [Oceaniferula marina]
MTDTLVYVHQHAADQLRSLARPDAIVDFINQLQSRPGTVGDHRQPDPRGRMVEVKILGRHAVIFFSDPFAGMIKILDICHIETP